MFVSKKSITLIYSMLFAYQSYASSANWSTQHYQQALSQMNSASPDIKQTMSSAPKAYEFESHLTSGSSVSYSGQIFRHILINDLKTYIGNQLMANYPGDTKEALDALMSYYDYNFENSSTASGAISGLSEFTTSVKLFDGAKATILEGELYDDIQLNGKQLRNKTAGNDNPLRRGELKGWSKTQFAGVDLKTLNIDKQADGFVEPEDLIVAWMRVMATNMAEGVGFTYSNNFGNETINQAYITQNGWNLNELINKFLYASVAFSQACGDYLSSDLGAGKGILASDTDAYAAGTPYTAREHHWDEAFGYYAAARDNLSYTDQQLYDKVSRDSNGDGFISLLAETNFAFARNAGRFDLTAKNSTSFSETIMNHFLTGRHLITARPHGYEPYLKAISTLLCSEWERTIAVAAVHYINKTHNLLTLSKSANFSFAELAKYWSELKGFALAFQFSPVSMLNDFGFDKLHELIGDEPVIPNGQNDAAVNTYMMQILEARQILQDAFQLDPENVKNW